MPAPTPTTPIMDYEITAVIDRYRFACRNAGCKPNPYIQKVLDMTVTTSKPSEAMYLRLCGNNFMLTEERLTDEDIITLFAGLSHNEYITRIDLRYNLITDKGAVAIADYLEKNPYLRELDLMSNDIGESGAIALAMALQSNQNLLSLKMNGNKFGRRGGMAFAQALQINVTLAELDIGETDQKIDSLIAMATVLRENMYVRAVNLNRPLLFTHQEEHIVHYANMLKVNRNLTELHIQKCDLKDFGMTRLAEALMDNMFLQYLDISCNRVTRDGAKMLAKLLRRNSVLKVVDLGYNRIEDDGAIELADAFMMNASVKTLCIKHNNIGDEGLCSLANSLEMNTTLTQLFIWGNHWEPRAASKFGSLLECGRLAADDVDIDHYVVDDVSLLSENSNSLRPWYYAEPFYKPQNVKHPPIEERFQNLD